MVKNKVRQGQLLLKESKAGKAQALYGTQLCGANAPQLALWEHCSLTLQQQLRQAQDAMLFSTLCHAPPSCQAEKILPRSRSV